jgi:hypothetical protein
VCVARIGRTDGAQVYFSAQSHTAEGGLGAALRTEMTVRPMNATMARKNRTTAANKTTHMTAPCALTRRSRAGFVAATASGPQRNAAQRQRRSPTAPALKAIESTPAAHALRREAPCDAVGCKASVACCKASVACCKASGGRLRCRQLPQRCTLLATRVAAPPRAVGSGRGGAGRGGAHSAASRSSRRRMRSSACRGGRRRPRRRRSARPCSAPRT